MAEKRTNVSHFARRLRKQSHNLSHVGLRFCESQIATASAAMLFQAAVDAVSDAVLCGKKVRSIVSDFFGCKVSFCFTEGRSSCHISVAESDVNKHFACSRNL